MKLKSIFLSVRPYSFTASLVPVFICFLFAKYEGYYFKLTEVILMVIGVISIHSATNLVNDYFDFKKGVDRTEKKDSSRVLIDNILSQKEVILLICYFYFLAIIVGLYFILNSELILIWFVLIGLLGSFFYTGGKKSLKYVALGEVAVFLLMGPLLFSAIYFAITSSFSFFLFFLSLSIGIQITSILTANNIRDLLYDKESGIKTLPILIGKKMAIKLYTTEIFLSFFIVFLLGINNYFFWLAFLSLPVAFILTGKIKNNHNNIVEDTAKFQMFFGVLVSFSIILGIYI
jgi:1,4-dihydroxy-2-naphthoate polyprenyltransferase